jgi:MFS family permease
VVTFLAGPLVAVIATFAATLLLLMTAYLLLDLALGGSLLANEETHTPPSPLEIGLIHAGILTVCFVPFTLSAWFFARLGRRSGRPVWGIVACGIIALIAVNFYSDISFPGPDDTLGSFSMGFRTICTKRRKVLVEKGFASHAITGSDLTRIRRTSWKANCGRKSTVW